MLSVYNIKMRSAKGGRHEEGGEHISGAERIVSEKDLDSTIQSMVKRALEHSKGRADFINISLEEVKARELVYLRSLEVRTIETSDYLEGRKVIIDLLEESGLERKKSQRLLKMLEDADSMRGAMLVDIHSLERLEDDFTRGVRATGMDWTDEAGRELRKVLAEGNCYNMHSKEALALATKVANAPGIVAEICWSDDPDYVAGYVASKKIGYSRITKLKPFGAERGGRLFCFDSQKASKEECLAWIEEQTVLLNEVACFRGRQKASELIGEKI